MKAAANLFNAGAPSAISPDQIRAAVTRERRALAALGRFEPDAERQAVAVTRAKLGNAADLAEVQANPTRCQACGDILDDTRPVVAVMTGRPRSHLWLHAGTCHEIHRQRHAERIDALMAAAGFGAAAPTHPQEAPAP